MEVRFSFHRTIIAYLLYFFVVVQLSTANNVQQPQEDEDEFNLNVSVAQEQQQHGNYTSTPRLWIPTPPNYGNGSSSKEEAESQMIITSRHLETNNLLKNLSMFHQPSSSSEVRYKQPPSFGGEVDYAAAGVKRNGRLRKIIPMHLSTPEILLSPQNNASEISGGTTSNNMNEMDNFGPSYQVINISYFSQSIPESKLDRHLEKVPYPEFHKGRGSVFMRTNHFRHSNSVTFKPPSIFAENTSSTSTTSTTTPISPDLPDFPISTPSGASYQQTSTAAVTEGDRSLERSTMATPAEPFHDQNQNQQATRRYSPIRIQWRRRYSSHNVPRDITHSSHRNNLLSQEQHESWEPQTPSPNSSRTLLIGDEQLATENPTTTIAPRISTDRIVRFQDFRKEVNNVNEQQPRRPQQQHHIEIPFSIDENSIKTSWESVINASKEVDNTKSMPKEEKEEDNRMMPFKVSDSLENALSSATIMSRSSESVVVTATQPPNISTGITSPAAATTLSPVASKAPPNETASATAEARRTTKHHSFLGSSIGLERDTNGRASGQYVDISPEFSSDYRYPWERKRGELNEVLKSFISSPADEPTYSKEVLVPFGAITENDDDDNNRSLSWPFSSVKPTTTPTPTTTTSKTSSSSSTTAAVNSTATTEYSSLSTLIPFPQVVSGAQFYVDQHISHGQFGRGSSMPSLVYDPNVLTSRYGYAGMLPIRLSDGQLVRFGRKPKHTKIRKPPTNYGVQTMASGHRRLLKELRKLKTQRIPTDRLVPPDAVLFFIPPVRGLSVSQAIESRLLHGWPSSNRHHTIPKKSSVAPAAKQPLSESPLASTNRVLPPLPASTGSEENPLFGFHRIEAEMEMISKMTRPPAEITQQKLSWVDNKVDVGTVVKSSRTELGERQLPEVPSSRAEIIPNHRLYSNKTVEVVTAARPNVVVLDSSRRDDRSDCSVEISTSNSTSFDDLPSDVGPAISACFNRAKNCSLTGASPIERLENLDEEQCVQYCVGLDNCASVHFSKNSSAVCEIFDVAHRTHRNLRLRQKLENHYYEPKYLATFDGKTEKAKRPTKEKCWNELILKSQKSTTATTPSTNFVVQQPRQLDTTTTNTFAVVIPRPTRPLATRPPPKVISLDAGMNIFKKKPPLTTTMKKAENSVRSTKRVDGYVSTTTLSPSAQEVPKDVCQNQRDIVIFKSTGYRLRPSPTAGGGRQSSFFVDVGDTQKLIDPKSVLLPLRQRSSETECIFSCLINLANGRLPYECLASTFNLAEGQCLLYGSGSGSEPDGNVRLMEDPAFNHYEKGCVLVEMVELCRGYPIARHPQKTLLGFALTSKRTNTLMDCIEFCFMHNKNFTTGVSPAAGRKLAFEGGGESSEEAKHVKCRSIMFYYEEADQSDNCILNSETRESAPSFFIDDTEALVDYASFDACYDVRDSEEASSSELSSNDRPSSAADNSRQRSAEEDVESTGVHHHSSFLKNATVVPPVSLPLLPIDDVVRAVPRMMAVATMTRQPNNKDDAERGVFAYKVDSDSGASATTTIMIPSEFHSVTLAPKKQTPPSDGNLATKPSSQRRRLKPINKHRKVVDSDQVKAAMRQRQMKEKQKPVNPDGQIRIKVTRSSRSQNTENVNDDAREDSIMRLMPPNDEIRS